eukprot:TRINITY_DN1462_c0_g1_i1.p1 TRINITY_DN1462_c0_g1~~TRINITY_DN1462_c0_g1_i1.p1  ORF type:complete len:130 (-),score=15.17 TRINITY_DN1462_c0_g1_i1:500-889(-)
MTILNAVVRDEIEVVVVTARSAWSGRTGHHINQEHVRTPRTPRACQPACTRVNVRVWHAQSGKALGQSLRGRTDLVTWVGVSVDGTIVVEDRCEIVLENCEQDVFNVRGGDMYFTVDMRGSCRKFAVTA